MCKFCFFLAEQLSVKIILNISTLSFYIKLSNLEPEWASELDCDVINYARRSRLLKSDF